jgi:predicted 3-demethylubiquinone-9 3-methyltransferase (glyoxalase superfamily)
MQKITPFLWYENQAEQAAKFYTSIFKNSRILDVSRFGEGVPTPTGSVILVTFELEGQQLIALNGGPEFKFNESISLFVSCETQAEVDYYWERLTEGGEEGQCGWLKDRFGLSWQVAPVQLNDYLGGSDPEGARRAMQAMLPMKKLDIEKLRKAYEGG